MSEPVETAPSFPPERTLPPFHPLHCPREFDRLKIFLETSPKTILFGDDGLGPSADPNRPFGSFLAPARFEGNTLNGRVVYDLARIASQNPRPLDYLSSSEIAAFRSAAERFLDEALPEGRMAPEEKALRRSFALPDPDLEPDAYWTYGPESDRRLVVLWGVELKRSTSLPPIHHDALDGYAGPTVVEKLREMPAVELQRRALSHILESNHPLKAFLAVRTIGEDGQPVLRYGDKDLPAKAAKPFSFLHESTYQRFVGAAEQFTAGTHPNAAAQTAEESMRSGFRVPPFDKKSPDYANLGSPLAPRPVVLIPPDFDPANGIPLLDISGAPVASADPLAPRAGGERREGLATAWRRHVLAMWITGATLGGIALVVLGILGAIFYSLDSSPPRVVREPATPDQQSVRLVFSEPLLDWQMEESEPPSVEIRQQGRSLAISGISLVDEASAVEITLAESMELGGEYLLLVEGFADQSLKGNTMPLTEVLFSYAPTPKLGTITAGAINSRLELVFSTPLDRESLGGAFFEIEGVELRGRPQLRDESVVLLESQESLLPDGEYVLTVEGVTSAFGRLMEPVRERRFIFKDNRAPVITEVVANVHPTLTILKPDERLVETSFTPEAVSLSTPQGPVKVYLVAVNADEPDDIVVLHDPIAVQGQERPEVTIDVSGLKDKGGNAPRFAEGGSYHYRGRLPSGAPEVAPRRSPDAEEPVVLYFEGPWNAEQLKQASYTLRPMYDHDGAMEVDEEDPPIELRREPQIALELPESPLTLRASGSMMTTEVVVEPEHPLDQHTWYRLEVRGARDPYGLLSEGDSLAVEFQTSGIVVPVQNFVSAAITGGNRRQVTIRLSPDRLTEHARDASRYVLTPELAIERIETRPGLAPEYTSTVILHLARPIAAGQEIRLRRMRTIEGVSLDSPDIVVDQPLGSDIFGP